MNNKLTDERINWLIDYVSSDAGISLYAGKDIAQLLRELQERRKADSKPVAYADPQAFINFQAGEARREWMWRSPDEDLIPLYTTQPAPVVPEIDRKAIADKVYGKCCRIPGATFYNAAEFAIDEMEACRAAMQSELQERRKAEVVVPDDYFSSLVAAARVRADKAMRKFPQPNYVLNKVAEESGEVIKAVIHYTEGREEWTNVEGEIIDNLAMLIRLIAEGDQVIGFTPPDTCRTVPQPAPVVPDSEPVADVVAWHKEGEERTCDIRWRRFDVEPGPLYAVPQSALLIPETLPCAVELKPGLIIGKGCKTETLLTALQRRTDYYAEINSMTPEERAEHDANIAAFKAMLPQQAQVDNE